MRSLNYFINGFYLIFRPGLRRYVAIPFCINVLVYSLMIWFGLHEFQRLVHGLLEFFPSWLQWFGVLLWVVFVLFVWVVLAYTFSLVANIVAAPFNGFLSEKIEEMLLGCPVAAPLGVIQMIKLAPRMVLRQLQCVGYFLVMAFGVLVIFLIPGLHLLAVLLWYGLSSWLMAMQYIDYPMDSHGVSFKKMRKMMAQNRALYLSFGAMVMLVSMIPLLNFIVIPAAVAGATELWVTEYRRTAP